jgi:hypothetical protein
MSLDKIKRGRQKEPVRLVLYGTNGIGKSTFITQAPNSIILDIEGGAKHLDCARFNREDLKTFTEVKLALISLIDEPHDFKFVGIDTLDWLEQLIFAHTCKNVSPEKNHQSIEDYGYGKGYVFAQKYWMEFLELLSQLSSLRKMNVILTAHSIVKNTVPPDADPYDRYQPDLHKDSFSLIRDWSDGLFFANYKTYTRKVEVGMKTIKQGTGDGERVMYCQERPAFWAKNRWDFPLELPFSFQAFAEHYAAWLGTNETTDPKGNSSDS